MKLGIFLPNANNGFIISKAAPRYEPTAKHNLEITCLAESLGMEFVLSMVKYRGFGGEVGYWDGCLDSVALTGALAQATSRIQLITTIGVLAVHPALAARALATLDDISEGRVGLNVVAGWNMHEYAQMGLWRGKEHYEQRYQYAAEYMEIVHQLWRTGTATFKGQFFDLTDCHCFPKPRHPIQVVCAGQSPAGMEFTAKYADYNFTAAPPKGIASILSKTQAAADAAGRQVGTLAYVIVIARETDAEAEAVVQDITDNADQEAIGNLLASAALDTSKEGTSQRMIAGLNQSARDGNLAFHSAPVLYGSYASVAEQFDALAAMGLGGAMLVFPDYVPDLRSFGDNVMPRLTCR
ncbi:MAG: LLM class flavin-dependent oxidoreductase [Rhizobiales bacterium]|nr:LLM class flavin-dependent oxidoreductase [Hyphomicrobiales bacterium]